MSNQSLANSLELQALLFNKSNLSEWIIFISCYPILRPGACKEIQLHTLRRKPDLVRLEASCSREVHEVCNFTPTPPALGFNLAENAARKRPSMRTTPTLCESGYKRNTFSLLGTNSPRIKAALMNNHRGCL